MNDFLLLIHTNIKLKRLINMEDVYRKLTELLDVMLERSSVTKKQYALISKQLIRYLEIENSKLKEEIDRKSDIENLRIQYYEKLTAETKLCSRNLSAIIEGLLREKGEQKDE